MRLPFKRMWNWVMRFFKKREKPPASPPPQPVRRKVDTETIRIRITTQGWKLREIPIKKSSPNPEERKVIQWRVIAFRGEKSLEVSGLTIDEAIKNIGQTLGVIPKQ